MKALHIKSPSGKVHFVIADTLWHGINKVMKTEDYKYKTIEMVVELLQ